MGEIVNLRQARKRQDQERRDAVAAANRAKHGRTGAERRAEALEAKRRERAHEGTRLQPEPKER